MVEESSLQFPAGSYLSFANSPDRCWGPRSFEFIDAAGYYPGVNHIQLLKNEWYCTSIPP